MGSTLEHGIYLPSEGEKNCYQGLAGNWNKVDGALGDVAGLKQLIESKFTKEIVTELPTEDINPYCIYMILKTDPETNNIYDEWVYINNAWEYLGNTQVDMTQYYTKQEVNELPAVASGVTSTKVGNYDAHIANGDIHVTASDKAKWDTVALIKQLRLVNTQVGSATTIAFANIDDTNGIKVGDKCMDLDAKLFEITAVDATNETVTVGSALIDIALDANVVHNSGNETVEGSKTFADGVGLNSWLYFTNTSVTKGTIPQTTVSPYRIYFGSGVNYGNSLFNIDTSVSNTGVQTLTLRSAENVVSGDDTRLGIIYDPALTQPRCIKFKGDCLPNENNTYDCGKLSLAWKNVNAYLLSSYGTYFGNEASVNARTNLVLTSNRDTSGKSGIYITKFRQNKAQGSMGTSDLVYISFDVLENEVRTNNTMSIQCSGWVDDVPTKVKILSGISDSSFGSSARPSKINDLEPSALGMPDFDNAVDISGYITTGNTDNLYTPPANGWIWIRCIGNGVGIVQGDFSINANYVSDNVTDERWVDANLFVTGGVQATIRLRSISSIKSAKFYPCKGNI